MIAIKHEMKHSFSLFIVWNLVWNYFDFSMSWICEGNAVDCVLYVQGMTSSVHKVLSFLPQSNSYFDKALKTALYLGLKPTRNTLCFLVPHLNFISHYFI